MSERVHCWRCTMSFEVGESGPLAHTSSCAEAKCRVPFWSGFKNGAHEVRCGVWPEFADRFETEPRIIAP